MGSVGLACDLGTRGLAFITGLRCGQSMRTVGPCLDVVRSWLPIGLELRVR